MKKVALTIALGIFVLFTNHASGQTVNSTQEKKSAVHISFIPPLSTNGIKAAEYTNTFSLNLLAGISKNEQAFTLGGLANIIRNNSRGFQMAGLANISGDVEGVQVAGLVNIAKHVKGVQLAGLINIADRSDYPIGLINIIKKGEMSIAAGYNEIGTAGVTFRSGGKVTYGILGVGYNHKTKGDAFVVLGGLGAHIHINSWLRINNEITGETIGNFSDETTFKAGYALMPAFRIGQHVELFGGPSINYMQTDDVKSHDMFPSNSLWKSDDSSKLKQVFVGYQVGIQYVF